MPISNFIKSKLPLISKDKQEVFKDLVEPLSKMADDRVLSKTIHIPADGNWFKITFSGALIKENRLVIKAERIKEGIFGDHYIVEFDGTRAAYLRGYYESSHRVGKWPYISWDVRSYVNNPYDPSKRIYVEGFYAHNELKKMINRMEANFGTRNILNTYINDNLLRLQVGVRSGKTAEEVEKEWSRGMMESLGYQHVEALDTGVKKGCWHGAKVHWFKVKGDSLS